MPFDTFSNPALALRNRIVMAPMMRCRADHADAVPNALIAIWDPATFYAGGTAGYTDHPAP